MSSTEGLDGAAHSAVMKGAVMKGAAHLAMRERAHSAITEWQLTWSLISILGAEAATIPKSIVQHLLSSDLAYRKRCIAIEHYQSG